MLPNPTVLASTWNEALLHEAGELLAEEAVRQGVDVVLGPTINLHRSPLGGRLFERFSEDPLLTGRRPRPGPRPAGPRCRRLPEAPGRQRGGDRAARSTSRSTTRRCARSICCRSRSLSLMLTRGCSWRLQPGQRPPTEQDAVINDVVKASGLRRRRPPPTGPRPTTAARHQRRPRPRDAGRRPVGRVLVRSVEDGEVAGSTSTTPSAACCAWPTGPVRWAERGTRRRCPAAPTPPGGPRCAGTPRRA